MTWFPGRNSSLLWSFNFKFRMHVVCGYGQKLIYCQRYYLQNGRLAGILDFVWFPDSNFSLASNIKSKWHITCVYRKEPIDFQQCHFQNGCLAAIFVCFFVSELYSWHGFWGVTLLWSFNFKFSVHAVFDHGQKPTHLQICHFQNGCLVAILEFCGFRILTPVQMTGTSLECLDLKFKAKLQ